VLAIAAGFAILVAIMVVGLWIGSLVQGAVPELATEPWEIRFHIAAELGMAALLAAGGLLALAGIPGAEGLLLLGLGAVLYSIVNSSGYYAERRRVAPLVMFGILFVVTVAIATGLVIA
jgi:hypothetical protein